MKKLKYNEQHTTERLEQKGINLMKLSKKLTWLLRHGATKLNIPIQSNGYIQVNDILQHPQYRGEYSLELLRHLTANDKKKRFTLRRNPSNNLYEIKANQGHSIEDVRSDLCLTRILHINELPVVAVHGTYYRHWSSIKQYGLKRMSRNHIHFAISDDNCDGVISGFRHDCDLLIYLDVKKVFNESNMPLYRSDNYVLLCSGMEENGGCIPTAFFIKVLDRHNKQIIKF